MASHGGGQRWRGLGGINQPTNQPTRQPAMQGLMRIRRNSKDCYRRVAALIAAASAWMGASLSATRLIAERRAGMAQDCLPKWPPGGWLKAVA